MAEYIGYIQVGSLIVSCLFLYFLLRSFIRVKRTDIEKTNHLEQIALQMQIIGLLVASIGAVLLFTKKDRKAPRFSHGGERFYLY